MDALRNGDRLGRYTIQSMIGGGGMGHVYLARDEAFGGRLVALKVPRIDDLSDTQRLKGLARFAREAEALRTGQYKDALH